MANPTFNQKCGKACHSSKKIAKASMRALNKTLQYRQKKLTGVYYCDVCSHWHTTSIDKTISRQIGDYKKRASELTKIKKRE